jgi:enamine deaminase RidA (YjgF/YER057c/UK114 family)
MISIELPDGSHRDYPGPVTVEQVAASIGPGLAKAALGGDLSRIRRIVKLNGFIASKPTFIEQHLVMNGASNLIANVLGDAGIHARAAIGMAALPFNAAVEIDAVIEIA